MISIKQRRRNGLRHYYRHRAQINADRRKNYAENRESILRSQRLKRRRSGGVTADQARQAIKRQRNRCALCGKPFTRRRPACTDHDHATKSFRGMIHATCNLGLGLFHDDVRILRRAIVYLKKRRKA